MKPRSALTIIVLFGLLALAPEPARAVTTPASTLEWSKRVLENMLTLPEGGIPRSILDEAQAVAVFPNAIRSNLSGGGTLTEGIIVAKGPGGTWSNPAFVILDEPGSGETQGGLALANDFFLVFRDKVTLSALEKGSLSLGSDATVAGGPLKDAVLPDKASPASIYSYTRNDRTLAGLALSGTVLRFDKASNEDFYGTRGITLAGILDGKGIEVPVAAGRLKCTLAFYINEKQMCG